MAEAVVTNTKWSLNFSRKGAQRQKGAATTESQFDIGWARRYN